jgi:hypothetical protein
MNINKLSLRMSMPLLVAFLSVACGILPPSATPTPTPIPVGAVDGRIVSAGTGEPLENAQIIVCEVLDEAYEHLICTLRGAPTTVSDSDGTFELTDVPTGTYIVMYGLPGLLKMTPEAWDGIDVTRGTFCMQGGQNSVCDIEGVTPSAFWAEGALQVGEVITTFVYQEDEQQPGVVILAEAEEGSTGEHYHVYQGTIHSNHTSISANVVAGQYSPEIEVIRNEAVTVEIEAPVEHE